MVGVQSDASAVRRGVPAHRTWGEERGGEDKTGARWVKKEHSSVRRRGKDGNMEYWIPGLLLDFLNVSLFSNSVVERERGRSSSEGQHIISLSLSLAHACVNAQICLRFPGIHDH